MRQARKEEHFRVTRNIHLKILSTETLNLHGPLDSGRLMPFQRLMLVKVKSASLDCFWEVNDKRLFSDYKMSASL